MMGLDGIGIIPIRPTFHVILPHAYLIFEGRYVQSLQGHSCRATSAEEVRFDTHRIFSILVGA